MVTERIQAKKGGAGNSVIGPKEPQERGGP